MMKNQATIFQEIKEYIDQLEPNTIPESRKSVLQPLIEFIQLKASEKQSIRINFICTHNSRRSVFSQVWAQTMASYFGVNNLFCYSGGTECTAVFPKVIETLQKTGYHIDTHSNDTNPIYSIKFGKNEHPLISFSKTFDDPFNPESEFAAIMTCSSADGDCPFIAGAEKRIPITYEDPKLFDDTPEQDEQYMSRSQQIATEMYYIFSKI
jgi:arsenate reductase